MATRSFKPTSPGRRFMSVSDFAEVTKSEPEKSLLGPAPAARRPQRQRPHHDAPPGRRPQAPLPHHRLQAPEGRRAGQGRRDRVRPQPLGAHRAAALRRRREGLHPRAATGSRSARSCSPGPTSTCGRATACRCSADPDRHHGARHRAAPRPGRQDGPLRRHAAPARGQGGRARAAAPAVRRAAPRRPSVPRHGRPGRQPDAPERDGRQGRSLALARQAPGRARHRDEPGRPPARRRRGQEQGLASGHAVGQADARPPHARPEEGVHRRRSSAAASAGRAGSRQ